MNFSHKLQKFGVLHSLIIVSAMHSFYVIVEPAKMKNSAVMKRVDCRSKPEYMVNMSCQLKILNRDVQLLNMEATPKVVLYMMQLDIAVFKRYTGGYRPYYGKLSLNFCEFLKGKFNPFVGVLRKHLQKYTNFNHTCPYPAYKPVFARNFDISGISPGNNMLVPEGDYRFDVNIYEVKRLHLGGYSLYVQVKEVLADQTKIKSKEW